MIIREILRNIIITYQFTPIVKTHQQFFSCKQTELVWTLICDLRDCDYCLKSNSGTDAMRKELVYEVFDVCNKILYI